MPEVSAQLFLKDEAATVDVGEQLGRCLADGAVVYLSGVLGAGKTTLCRGILRAYGYSGAVKSPTYTLVEPYDLTGLSVFHFDLYRLGDPEELEYMGIRDYFQKENICIVEWPARGQGFLPKADINAELQPQEDGRQMTLSAFTERGKCIVKSWQ